MCKNYADLIRNEFKKFSPEDFEIGKTANFHIERMNMSLAKIKRELLAAKNLKAVTRDFVEGEERYNLYFVYNIRKGAMYTITFRKDKIRLITSIPLGKKTIMKTQKKLRKIFKKDNPLDLK